MFLLLLSLSLSKKYSACTSAACDAAANTSVGLAKGDRIKIVISIFNETTSTNTTETNETSEAIEPLLLEGASPSETAETTETLETLETTETTSETSETAETSHEPGEGGEGGEGEPEGPPVSYFARFYPTIDKLSVLEVPDPNCTIRDILNSQVTAAVPGNRTSARHRYRRGAHTAEYLSLLLYLERGNVTHVLWDTTFDTGSCRDRTYTDGSACYVPRAVGSDCDGRSLKVFVGFVGTDRDNVPLTSAEYMPSSFLKYGAGGVVDDISGFVKDVTYWFK